VTPAIALANEIRARRPEAEFLYVGTRAGKEAEIVPKYGIELTFVRAHQWGFEPPWQLVRFAFRLARGVLRAMWILLRKRPDAVIGTGGYVAAPLIFANVILRKLGLSKTRTIIHEQNTTPGKLNHLVGRGADLVLVSFPDARRYFPSAVYVGYPVRGEIHPQDRAGAKERLGIPPDTQVILVFGGSSGARTINRAVIDALPILGKRGNLKIIHGTGGPLTGYDPVADCRDRLAAHGLNGADLDGWYEAHQFIDRMADYYAAADLVVGRAGAGTLAELCASGRPALLIPKSNLAGDHQVMNALELVRAGAASIIYEDVTPAAGQAVEFVSGAVLAERIAGLLDCPDRLARMAAAAASLATPQAVSLTVDLIERLLDGERIDSVRDGLPAPPRAPAVFADLPSLTGEGLLARAEPLVADLAKQLQTPLSFPREREEELVSLMKGQEVFEYLRYRTAACLASASWRIRNAGVKLVGVLRMREKLPILLDMVSDRTPAPLVQRMLGGDYQQKGFIRRNIMVSVGRLGVHSSAVRRALLGGLVDPYFEVRSATARTIADLADLIVEDAEIEEALVKATGDRSFDVIVEAVRALGTIGHAERVVPRLQVLMFDERWKVRQAVLVAYQSLLERRQKVDVARLRAALDEMMVTSTGFVPSFTLKTAIYRLGELMRASEHSEGDR